MVAVMMDAAEGSMAETAIKVRRFTRREYERMAEEGILRPDERVELLDGEIVVVSPQKSRHATVLQLVAKAVERAFGTGHCVRSQLPVVLGTHSEPEPDVAVVMGQPDDYLDEHPRSAVLIVEVSETTLALDRGKKLEIYAKAGIQDYWIVNLVDRVVEVHRSPRPTQGKRGWTYQDVKLSKATDTIRPLAARSGVGVATFLR